MVMNWVQKKPDVFEIQLEVQVDVEMQVEVQIEDSLSNLKLNLSEPFLHRRTP